MWADNYILSIISLFFFVIGLTDTKSPVHFTTLPVHRLALVVRIKFRSFNCNITGRTQQQIPKLRQAQTLAASFNDHTIMKECYQIKEPQELTNYLKDQGRDAFHDWDYQLQTNFGFVHKLKNGQVAFFDNHFNQKAILFNTEKCFNDVIKADKFPIDNPEQEMFDVEGDRMKVFHLQADYYRKHLNNVLKFDFKEINKEAAEAYLKKVIGRFIKKLTTSTDIVALISVIGELVKQETNGKWFLVKRYGTYNPIYEPNIVTGDGNVVLMSSTIIGQVKWRVSSLDHIFIDVHSKLTEPIKWKKYSKERDNLVLLE